MKPLFLHGNMGRNECYPILHRLEQTSDRCGKDCTTMSLRNREFPPNLKHIVCWHGHVAAYYSVVQLQQQYDC